MIKVVPAHFLVSLLPAIPSCNDWNRNRNPRQKNENQELDPEPRQNGSYRTYCTGTYGSATLVRRTNSTGTGTTYLGYKLLKISLTFSGIEEQLFVDTTRGAKLKINVDIVFPKIGCDFLSLDAQDVSGEQHIAIGKKCHSGYLKGTVSRKLTPYLCCYTLVESSRFKDWTCSLL